MSTIPNSAMPHAYAHDDEEQDAGRGEVQAAIPSTGMLIGGAIAAYLLYRVLR